MMPVVELRGAIPFGVSLGLDWREVYLTSVIGNMLPVPFIILFFRPLIEYFEKTKLFGKIASKLKKRTKSKMEGLNKYKMFGLFLFVAIPLPGTGAWTGAAIAALLKMRIKHSFFPILLGVVVAGILMMGISYGFGELISHFF
ncbi:MAG: small multi-drug export protein [Clostridia bacterium]|nr:small multi-drug export protein [Clostridia bacterium]MBO7288995.1 small multi-drug export protein [Clostridia bacterium]